MKNKLRRALVAAMIAAVGAAAAIYGYNIDLRPFLDVLAPPASLDAGTP
jgi:hypothetical protein